MHPYGEVLPYAAQPHHRRRRPATTATACRSSKIDYRIGDNERKMAEHMYDTAEEIAKAAGAELVDYKRGDIDRNGSAIHEHGTCRMGDDPKRSALNALQPDARGEERLRRRRLGLPDRDREEPDAHHPGPVVARHRLPGRAAEERRLDAMQVIKSPKVYPVIVIGSGAAGGHGRVEPDAEGRPGAGARRRRQVRPRQVLDARAPVGGARAPGQRRGAASVLSRHEGAALQGPRRQALRPDAGLGPGRQDQRLGPRQPAPVGDRLQGRGRGRLGDPLADLVRRHLALLRQGRAADRRLRRHRRFGDAARQQVPPAGAGAALRRAADAEGRQVARHRHRRRPPRQHDHGRRAASRPATTAAAAAPAATPRRSSTPPIT